MGGFERLRGSGGASSQRQGARDLERKSGREIHLHGGGPAQHGPRLPDGRGTHAAPEVISRQKGEGGLAFEVARGRNASTYILLHSWCGYLPQLPPISLVLLFVLVSWGSDRV